MIDIGASGPYQHCRPLTEEEYTALKADIEQHGIREYVHVDENGAILVGHHRARAAAELGIEYPRHVVTGLSEREKHEYAVRLESLGRAKDPGTRRYTVVDLFFDTPGLKFNQQAIAELVGEPKSTVNDWIRAERAKRALAWEQNPDPDFAPPEPTRVTDAAGRSYPTTYKTHQPKDTSEPSLDDELETPEPPPCAATDSATVNSSDQSEPDEIEPERSVPVVGDVLGEIASQLDASGVFEAVAQEKARRVGESMRLWMRRFTETHQPEILAAGLRAGDLREVSEEIEGFIDWLARARDEVRRITARPMEVVS